VLLGSDFIVGLVRCCDLNLMPDHVHLIGVLGILLGPVFYLEGGDATELTFVVGDKDALKRQRMRSDQHIHRADGSSLFFQVGARLSVFPRRHVIVGEDFEGCQEFEDGNLVLFWS